MHNDAYIGGRSENNINASSMTISGERTEQLDIFCRVTGFTSDFLSFIDVDLIQLFHGALRFIPEFNLTCKLRYADLSLHFNRHFPGKPGLAGLIEAKDDGGVGDNWSYKTCKAPVKPSPLTNQHPTFYRLDALPVA